MKGDMENKFKIVMKKTDEVMKDFISFTYRAKGTVARFKVRVLAVGLAVIGILAAKDNHPIAGGVMLAIGGGFFVASFFVSQIAVLRVKAVDIAYQNKTELTYAFTNSGIYVYENAELSKNVGGYHNVTCFYGDEKNYYVGVNNEDLYLLPRKCFVEGDAEEFLEFIETKSNEKYEFLPNTIKNKWIQFRINQKQKDMEYNQRAAALREKDKEKRAQKRKKK